MTAASVAEQDHGGRGRSGLRAPQHAGNAARWPGEPEGPLGDAGTGQAEVTVSGGEGWAVVKVTDRGRGLDPDATPPSRRGIRESITGRMLAVGGRASIASRPGAGTTVTVSWPA